MYFNRADFGQRLVAYIIDTFIVGLIAGIPGGCLAVTGSFALKDTEAGIGILVILVLLTVVISIVGSILYYGLMWSKTGQTVGKKLMGIKVVTADGVPPGFWLAIGRATIGYALSSAVMDLGFLWMLWDDQQQTLHDKLFGTYVVKA
ncbi:MAG: RDD family protein [Anaerolineales bacterium]|nr:MAG: RDD family protein [Anaerolineales bacterium]